ncbi:MAG: hypothetical protein RIQ56_560 [Candidatus Parcubacteria bacterium]|jgi:hypothetical protein
MHLSAKLRSFAHAHDDLPAFHAGYLVLTFLFAAFLNIGAFGVLVLLHMSLDIVKYHDLHGLSWTQTLRGTLRESLLDVALLLVALVFAIYLHHATVIVAVSGLVRAEATILLALGTIIPKVEVMHHLLWIASSIVSHMGYIKPATQVEWTVGELIHITLSLTALVLIVLAPTILGMSAHAFGEVLVKQLVPWQL